MAGLPHSRCNFARVLVNGELIGQGVDGVNGPGVYVNAEPIMKRYIERNFNSNLNGNLYELEHHDDLISARIPFIGVESLSKFDDKADLKLADDQIAAHGLAGASQMMDLDQFIKIYAMEFLLKHWDGYSDNTNNTYLYNDVNAVASPGPSNVRFKMIPWGIDQILKPQHSFKMSTNGLIAKLVRNDTTRRTQLINQIRTYRDTIFAREVQQAKLKPLIDRMEALLVGFGVPNAVAEIAVVRQQLRLAASAGYLCAGLPETRPLYVLKDDTSECLHASNTEGIPAGQPNPVNFEIYHRPFPDNNDHSDLWRFGALGKGKSATNQAFGRLLHASTTFTTAQDHKYLYTCPTNNNDPTTTPRNSRSLPSTRRTASRSPAISHSPASGRGLACLSEPKPHPAAGRGSIRTPADPSSTSIERSAEPGAFVPGLALRGGRSVQRLEIHHVTTLDLPETSALTTCSRPGDPPRVLAVGDEDFAVVSAEIDDGGTLVRTWRDDLRPVLRHSAIDLRSGSGFEGVASDRDGTIVLLQEEHARLLVFAPDLSRLMHTLALAVPVDDPVLNPAWRHAPNSRGEGLLLLRRGHVLVAKERDTPCLIEFGAPGDRPIDVTPDTVLAPDEPFQPPDDAKAELVPLLVWQLGERTAAMLPTINDLALGPDGASTPSAHTPT